MDLSAKDIQVILNTGLRELTFIKTEKRACLGGGIRHTNQPGCVRVTDGTFQIFALLIQDFLHLFGQFHFLGAHFGSKRKQRTTKNMPAFSLSIRIVIYIRIRNTVSGVPMAERLEKT